MPILKSKNPGISQSLIDQILRDREQGIKNDYMYTPEPQYTADSSLMNPSVVSDKAKATPERKAVMETEMRTAEARAFRSGMTDEDRLAVRRALEEEQKVERLQAASTKLVSFITGGTRKNKKRSRRHKKRRGKKTRRHRSKRYRSKRYRSKRYKH